MPKIGEIKRAREINHRNTHKYIWLICPLCENGRWVAKSNLMKPNYTGICQHCYRKLCCAEKHWNWNGGRYRNSQGYILIHKPLHPFSDKNGYVFEHRLVLEARLGRPLLPSEISHHIDGDKSNNDDSNLMLFSSIAEHTAQHIAGSKSWGRPRKHAKQIIARR